MALVPPLAITEFADHPDCRAFDSTQPLADRTFDSDADPESPMTAEVFLLITSLSALDGVRRLWLLANTPDEPRPTRLLMQLEPGVDWTNLENTVLDILAYHFRWPYTALNAGRLTRTTCAKLPPELTEL